MANETPRRKDRGSTGKAKKMKKPVRIVAITLAVFCLVFLLVQVRIRVFGRAITPEIARSLLGKKLEEVEHVLGEPPKTASHMWGFPGLGYGVTEEDVEEWYRNTVFDTWGYPNGEVHINGQGRRGGEEGRVIGVSIVGGPRYGVAFERMLSLEPMQRTMDADDGRFVWTTGQTALHVAASEDRKNEAQRLLANGADVNARETDGYAPLHVAVLLGHKAMVELLLANGADMDAKTLRGWTPLHWAVLQTRKEFVDLLLSNGADVNAAHPDGRTALHLATSVPEVGCEDVAELLLAKGADITAKDKHGGTPLHAAARQDNSAVAELILNRGADVNARQNDGATPLVLVVRTLGRVNFSTDGKATTELLIARGADVRLRDTDGRTPLHWASHGGYERAAEVLLANGADVNARDKAGRTALAIAQEAGCREMVRLLKQHGAKK